MLVSVTSRHAFSFGLVFRWSSSICPSLLVGVGRASYTGRGTEPNLISGYVFSVATLRARMTFSREIIPTSRRSLSMTGKLRAFRSVMS